MAKRRSEYVLLHDSPKRCCRAPFSIDIQAESMATNGGVSAPSVLALLGSRCRKRPSYFDDDEKPDDATLHPRTTLCDSKKRAANILVVPISSSFPDSRSSCTLTNKRPREDNPGPEKVIHTTTDKDKLSEDCTFNSFQYWRVPLPELDLSLLEDTSGHSKTKEKPEVGDSFSDDMET